ncbi:MAG: hypothetical protein ACKVQB_13770 [Bacteroidia bacterium]
MKIIKIISLLLIAFMGFQSCYYDVEEELYPTKTGCDTSNVTLLVKVKPILQKSCYTCHAQANFATLGAGINLESYPGIKTQVDNGKLLKSINHAAGASAMPKGSTLKIDACEIKIIEKWVRNGALDN